MKEIKDIRGIEARIEEVEETATFKAFLIRIGFKNYDEYVKLFGNNIFKRKLCTDWCIETYPHIYILPKNEDEKRY